MFIIIYVNNNICKNIFVNINVYMIIIAVIFTGNLLVIKKQCIGNYISSVKLIKEKSCLIYRLNQ